MPRRAIKAQLQSVKIGDVSFFKVWIHEDDAIQPGDADSWEKCMEKARNADLVIVLYNGACGWAMDRDEFRARIGICHADMHEALNRAPWKVWAVMLPEIKAKRNFPDADFQVYFRRQNSFLREFLGTGLHYLFSVRVTDQDCVTMLFF